MRPFSAPRAMNSRMAVCLGGLASFYQRMRRPSGGGGTANQWDKHQDVNPQFILTTVSGVHSTTCWRDQDTGKEDRAAAEIPVKW